MHKYAEMAASEQSKNKRNVINANKGMNKITAEKLQSLNDLERLRKKQNKLFTNFVEYVSK